MTSTNDFTIDLEHLGQPTYVAAQVLNTTDGPILLDTGPGSTLATLQRGLDRAGIRIGDLRAIFLSHIHFDHAGATGLLVDENPRLEVYVHERGAVHLVDPTKLVASARRVFGADFDRLWGRFLAVPVDRVRALAGGETVTIGNRRFEVAYTPGHAVHHVSYFEAADRTAYIGDCGGIRPPALPVALPVTPPPDFDLDAWLATLDTIEAWQPRRVFCTHFGFSNDPTFHFAELRVGLRDWVEITRQLLERDTTDQERAAAFERFVVDSLQGKATPEAIRARAEFSDYQASWYGIARYWRKKLPPPPS